MTQLTEHREIIGENEYTMTPMSPLLSNELLIALTKMIGPGLSGLLQSIMTSKDPEILNANFDWKLLGKMSFNFFENLDHNVLNRIMKEFARVTVVEGKGPLFKIFDIHFIGNIDEMYQWLFWGISVQWGKLANVLQDATSFVNQRGAQEQKVT